MEERIDQSKGMRPIWYFVGELLILVSLLVEVASIWQLFHPPAVKPKLWEIHAGIWWGGVIFLGGLILFLTNRHKRIT